MHEKILGHCKNNFENSLIFSREKKKREPIVIPYKMIKLFTRMVNL